LGEGAKPSEETTVAHPFLLAVTPTTTLALALAGLAVLVLSGAALIGAAYNARLVRDLRRREAEQAELNRALHVTTEQLEHLDRVKTDFVTIASHELRTPLAQVRGYTSLIQAMIEEESVETEPLAEMTAHMEVAADRLEQIIAAMLDVSQLDVDAMNLNLEEIRLELVMRAAIEPLTEAVRLRKLMLAARGLRALPPLWGDRERLAQAFRNVVVNAVKYTPDGGRIEILGEQRGDQVLITVCDSGIGIDPAHRELIFAKFFRTQDTCHHSTGATKFMGAGPGLGLTIARGVVEAHGGRIWMESAGHDPARLPGSRFYILLPLSPPQHARPSEDRALRVRLADKRQTRV